MEIVSPTPEVIHDTYTQQRAYFSSGNTLPLAFRLEQLDKLEQAIRDHENDIYEAVRADMGRPSMETFLLEIGPIRDEICETRRHLHTWSKPQRVSTPLLLQPGSSFLYPEPRGVSMIISAWNFPFTQLFIPLIGAIASGCTAILRPSEMSPASSHLVRSIIESIFDPRYVAVLEGGREVTESLFEHPLDLVFFTGSSRVGSIIMGHAAKQLIPTVLELGGKSPAIVDETANVALAARRISWSKYFNAGQICTTTDHVYVHEQVKETFIAEVQKSIADFYGKDPRQSPDYAHILTQAHVERLQGLLADATIRAGGGVDIQERFMEPTIVEGIDESHPLMQEEIFGPIMPILPYDDISAAITHIKARPKPLALSVFSRSQKTVDRVLAETSSGGVTINDTMIHAGSVKLPFGGVGKSGMGSYHGKYTFDAFTHYKPVFRRSGFMDLPFRYPPHAGKLPRLSQILSWLPW